MPALKIHEQLRKDHPDPRLSESDQLLFIHLLVEREYFTEAIVAMKEYLELYHSKATLVQLNLAKLYLDQGRPRAGLKILAGIDQTTLDSRQVALFKKLVKIAKSSEGTSAYELASDD